MHKPTTETREFAKECVRLFGPGTFPAAVTDTDMTRLEGLARDAQTAQTQANQDD